jgi:hypothetical protein
MDASLAVNHRKVTLQQLLQQSPDWQSHTHEGSHKTFRKIEQCRTAAMGYHPYHCNDKDCGYSTTVYHSCRNRHCPNCGNSKKEEWIESRLKELLPCKYYHVVFTVPHQLNELMMGNRKVLFKQLFDSSAYTLLKFGQDEQYMGARPGIVSVLHTWGQQLSFHPHVHCIVSGGGIKGEHQWVEAKKAKYGSLFPVQAMEMVYKAHFLTGMNTLRKNGLLRLNYAQEVHWSAMLRQLYALRWIVYAKQPFGGPQQVVEYLGRYTHKVAISNHRMKSIDAAGNVSFEYKDYADKGKKKLMKLSGKEFIRRFEQHLLPYRFVKIRHYGYLGNNQRKKRVNAVLAKMKLPQHKPLVMVPMRIRMLELTGRDMHQCPICKLGQLVKQNNRMKAPPE